MSRILYPARFVESQRDFHIARSYFLLREKAYFRLKADCVFLFGLRVLSSVRSHRRNVSVVIPMDGAIQLAAVVFLNKN